MSFSSSRNERVHQIRSLNNADWDLFTLSNLQEGLMNQDERVQGASMNVLMDFAKRNPKPIQITPISLIQYHIFDFTVASGYARYIFQFLVDLGTPEANETIGYIIKGNMRNEDFSDFIDILIKKSKLDLLKELKEERLSKKKTEILLSKFSDIEKES